MNKVFYIFRHGETNWNKERRCQGHTNTDLNEVGHEQALNLANKVKNLPIEIVITSDLNRALNTGKKVADALNVPIKIDNRLREMHYGKAEGMLFEEAIQLFGHDLWQKLMSFHPKNDYVGFPEGETRKEARERFVSVLEEMANDERYNHIAISTHGGALRNVLHSFLPPDHELIPIPNCVMYRLTYCKYKKIFEVDLEVI